MTGDKPDPERLRGDLASEDVQGEPATEQLREDRERDKRKLDEKYGLSAMDFDGDHPWSELSKRDVWVVASILGGFGARVDDDLQAFVDRHGRAKLVEAVRYTLVYLDGGLTRRGVGREMGVPVVEAIAVTKAIEPIIGVVQTDLSVHERKIRQSPVQRVIVDDIDPFHVDDSEPRYGGFDKDEELENAEFPPDRVPRDDDVDED